MSWKLVIILSVICGVIPGLLMVPEQLSGTSFQMPGISFEFWICAGLFISLNCNKPLDAGLKVFVFFLISQPLIYLVQVPFSLLGWGAVWLLPSMGAVHCVHFSRRHAGQPHNSAKVVECPYFAYPYGNSCIGASQHIYNYVHNIPENVANLFFHRLRASVASSGAAAGQR